MSNTHQEKASKQSSCGHGSTSGESHHAKEQTEMREALRDIKHKIVILSGKGGVGKSSVAANLAVTLSQKGFNTGLLDTDLHGPSIPTLLGIEGKAPGQNKGRMTPVPCSDTLKAMSVGLLVKDRTEAIVWRGPAKHGVIKELLTCVDWGKLDYLVVDCPPGTGDEPLSVIQLLQNVDGAVIVTTPQEVALVDVSKSVTFCRHLQLPVIGVIENMSGYACPHCGESTDIFKSGGGERLAAEMGVPFLGRIPLDPGMVSAGDAGAPCVAAAADSPAGTAMRAAFDEVIAFTG